MVLDLALTLESNQPTNTSNRTSYRKYMMLLEVMVVNLVLPLESNQPTNTGTS